MAKKPLYRVPQNETAQGWTVLNLQDNVVATCPTRSEARKKAKELIASHKLYETTGGEAA